MRRRRGRRGWPDASLELLLNDRRCRRVGGECGRYEITRERGEGQRQRGETRDRLREPRKEGRRLLDLVLVGLFGSHYERMRARSRAGDTRGLAPRGAHNAVSVAHSCARGDDAPVHGRGSGQGGHRLIFLEFRAATWDGWAPGARSNRGLEDSLSRRDRAPSDTTTVPLEVISRAGPPRSYTLLLVEPRVTCFHGVRGV